MMMMVVCIHLGSGRMIESQSAATPGTLLKNAVLAGHRLADVEERRVGDEEYHRLLAEASDQLAADASVVEKLAAVGISVDELRQLLRGK
jgi:hypothetical protein